MFGTTSASTRILDAARRLVRQRGYAAVSLRQIATEAAYSPAGLYAHFPGREGILEGLADEVRGELAAVLEHGAATEAAPVAQLVAIGVAYIAFALEQPAEFELLFRYTRSRKRNLTDPVPSSFDLLRRVAREAFPSCCKRRASSASVAPACAKAMSTTS